MLLNIKTLTIIFASLMLTSCYQKYSHDYYIDQLQRKQEKVVYEEPSTQPTKQKAEDRVFVVIEIPEEGDSYKVHIPESKAKTSKEIIKTLHELFGRLQKQVNQPESHGDTSQEK